MTKKQITIFETFFALIILALYVYVAVSNVKAVLNWFLTDDAFYYFQVARNVSEGVGFSFDGINLSNGFHPLWMFICIPVFALARFDLILPLRVLILVISLFHIGSFILLFRLLKRFLVIEIAALFSLLWAFTPIILNNVFKGGVESSVNVFFILLLWERLSKFNLKEKIDEKDIKQIFWLGVIATLTILSRLDNVFLVFFAGVWLWIKFWHSPNKETVSLKERWLWRFKTGTSFYGIIVLVMSSYLAWNKIVFGDYMPISGKVKLWWGNLSYSVYGHRVRDFSELIEELFSPDLNIGPWALLVSKIHKFTDWFLNTFWFPLKGEFFRSAVWGMMIFIVIVVVLLILFNKNKFIEGTIKLGLIPLFLGTTLQAAYYKRYGSIVQRSWYWVSEFIFIVIVVALLASLIYSLLSKWHYGASLALILVIFSSVWFPVKTIRNIISSVTNSPRSETHEYLLYAEFLEENFEPGTVLGMTGSGVWGYFGEDFTIINLDGLINSKEYFEMLKEGTAAEFLASNDLDYVMGSKYIITDANPYGKMFEGHLKEVNLRYRSPYTHLDIWEFIP